MYAVGIQDGEVVRIQDFGEVACLPSTMAELYYQSKFLE